MMADIQSRIQKQRQMMKGFQAMRSASGNPEVQRQAESNIRDAQRNISYLEESLQALIDRKGNTGSAATSDAKLPANGASYESPTGTITSGVHSSSGSRSSLSSTMAGSSGTRQSQYPIDASSAYLRSSQDRQLPPAPGAFSHNQYGGVTSYGYDKQLPGHPISYGPGAEQSHATGWAPAPVTRMATSARRNYTNLGESEVLCRRCLIDNGSSLFYVITAFLDLIKYETPLTTARISRMLHQLEFKLQIERQYKQGIDKMAALYQAEGDRKSRNDAESKRVESQSKIMLLQQALKRYKQLHVMDDGEDDQRE